MHMINSSKRESHATQVIYINSQEDKSGNRHKNLYIEVNILEN